MRRTCGAPTPTAAAELAVPVRLELLAALDALAARLMRGVGQGVVLRRQRLRDLAGPCHGSRRWWQLLGSGWMGLRCG